MTSAPVRAQPSDVSASREPAPAVEELKLPVAIEKPGAEYPRAALDGRVEGTAVLVVTVRVDGTVSTAEVVESAGEILDAAAVNAVKNWRFRPALLKGVQVASRIRVPFVFRLPSAPESSEPPDAKQKAHHAPAARVTHAKPTSAEAKEPRVVVVHGDRPSPERSASDITLRRDVLRAAPRRDAADLLTAAPGIYVSRVEGDAVGASFAVRGFDAGHGQDIEFKAAGIPLNQRSHLHGQGYTDLNFLPPEVVRSVRVTEGVYDPRQGDFAVAGSVLFDLGVEERGIRAETSYGSFDTRRYLALWAPPGEANETFGVVSFRSSDGFGMNRGGESALAMAQYWFGDEQFHGVVHAAAYGARAHLAGVLRLPDIEAGRVGFYDAYPDPTTQSQSAFAARSHLGFRLTSHIADDSETSVGAWLAFNDFRLRENFTGYTQRSRQQPDWAGRGDLYEKGNQSWSFGADARHRMARFGVPENGFEGFFELGIDTRTDFIEQEQNLLEAPQNETWDRRVDASIEGASVGTWADLNLHYARRIRLRGGLRADALYYDVDDRLGNFIPRFRRETNFVGFRRTALGLAAGPRVTLEAMPVRFATLFVAYGEGFRSPQARTLEEGEQAPYTKVRGAELGARGTFGKVGTRDLLSVTVAAYRTVLSDDLAFDAEEGRLERIGATTRVGAVAYAVAHPVPWVDAAASVTVVRATLDDPPLPTAADPTPAYRHGQLLPFVPPVVGRVDASVHGVVTRVSDSAVSGRLGFGLSYLSPRPLPYSRFADPVTLVDASSTLRFRFVEVGLQVFNLLDLQYAAQEFVHVSSFNPSSTPSRVPERHIAAGPPRMVLGTLTLHL